MIYENLCRFIGKRDSIVIKRLLEKMKYVTEESKALQLKKEILGNSLVIDDEDFIRYLKTEWFKDMKLWCACYRQFYHNQMDTTNISESWNKFSIDLSYGCA